MGSSRIKTKDFSNLTHAVEKRSFLLKEKMEKIYINN